MFGPWSMVQSVTAQFLRLVLVCATALTFPDYEFELNLYQQNIPWLTCPEGWTKFETSCFRVFPDKATFSEASTVCRSFGGHAVYVGSLNKNKVIGSAAETVQLASADVWLGFRKKKTDDEFSWDDGRVGNVRDGPWQLGQPVISNSTDLCVSLTISEFYGKFRWKIEKCDKVLLFVCERRACGRDEYHCMNDRCIPASWRCDRTQDCGDGSDELNCEGVCGGELVMPIYTFQSPVTDGSYPININCQWKIQGPVGQKIRLKFSTFDLEDFYDTLTIRDGPSSDDKVIAAYSGSELPRPITSTTNFLLVSFSSDHTIAKAGFQAAWEPVDAGHSETIVAKEVSGWITSPGYPENYMDNIHVTWTIRTNDDIIALQIIDLDLGDSDTLKIFDGSGEDADLITLFNGGDKTPEVLFTTGEYSHIQLNTDLIGTGKGFNITYQKGCDIRVHADYGVVSSPGYTSGFKYPPKLHCIISRLDAGTQETTLLFRKFDTELNFDIVQVYEGTTDEYLLKNASGYLDPWSVSTPTGQFVIHFTSDASLSGLGWTVSFSYGCHDDSVLPAHLHVSSQYASYGSSVTYNCDTGYQVFGSQHRYCDMGGAWRSPMPACKYIYCGPPRVLQNGELLNLTSRYNTGVAMYRCYPGYELVGNNMVTCTDQGWADFPVCEDILCPKLLPLDNGRTFTPNYNNIHQRVRFQCNTGYRLMGYTAAECHEIGKWSHPLPQCVPDNETMCAELKIAHGRVSRYERVPVGESVTVMCNKGYQLSSGSSNSVTCTETGDYNVSVIECRDVDECVTMETACDSKHTCVNTAGSFWCKCAAGYQHTELSEFSCEDVDECKQNNGGCEHGCENMAGSYVCICKDGYRQYTDNLTVIDDRVLVPGKSCYVLCPALQVENASLYYSSTPIPDGSYLYPTSVFIQCPNNTLLDGPTYVTCQENGDWDGSITKCLEVQCDEIPNFEDGFIEYTSDRHLGSFLKFSCDHGYILHGNQHRYCHLVDGEPKWSGEQPVCKAVDCGIPPGIPYGQQSFRTTTYNSAAVYKCKPGYRLVAQGIRTCLASGLWSTDIIMCVAETCSTPLMSEYVSMVTDLRVYTNNSQVKFTCSKAGYEISDPYPVMCHVPAQEFHSRSIQPPIHNVPLTVTLQMSSIDHLQGCSLHYGQKVYNWLDQVTVKQKLVESCKHLTPQDIRVQDAEIRIDTESKRIAINKTLEVSSGYLAIPVTDSCLQSIGDWFRGNGDVFELQSSEECPEIPPQYGSIKVHDSTSLCEEGEMVTMDDVTFCVHNTRGPVSMVMVTIQLTASGSLRLECLYSLREKMKNITQHIVNDLDLDNLCPEAEDIVVSDTSGSMAISNNDIGIRIPFFLYDLSTSFANVQLCSTRVQNQFDREFRSSVMEMTEVFRQDCSKLLFEPDDYFHLKSVVLCRHGFQYHEPSDECVFCDDCAIVPTPTIITTETVITTQPTSRTVSSTLSHSVSSLSSPTKLASSPVPTSTESLTTASQMRTSEQTTGFSSSASVTVEETSTTQLPETEATALTIATQSTKTITQVTFSTEPTVNTAESSTETAESTAHKTQGTTLIKSTTYSTKDTIPTEGTTDSTKNTKLPENTTETSKNTIQPESTTESTKHTLVTEITTETTKDTTPAESTIESTRDTLHTQSTTESTKDTISTETTIQSTKNTLPTQNTKYTIPTEGTSDTIPTESTSENTKITTLTESTTEGTKGTKPTESTSESTKGTLPTETSENPSTEVNIGSTTHVKESTIFRTTTNHFTTTKSTDTTTGMSTEAQQVKNITDTTVTVDSTRITENTKVTESTIKTTQSLESSSESTVTIATTDDIIESTETTQITDSTTASTDMTQHITESPIMTKQTKGTTEVTLATEVTESSTKSSMETHLTESTIVSTEETESTKITSEVTNTPMSSTDVTTSTLSYKTSPESTRRTTDTPQTDGLDTSQITDDTGSTKEATTTQTQETTVTIVTKPTGQRLTTVTTDTTNATVEVRSTISINNTSETTEGHTSISTGSPSTDASTVSDTSMRTTLTTDEFSTDKTVQTTSEPVTDQITDGSTVGRTGTTTELSSTDISFGTDTTRPSTAKLTTAVQRTEETTGATGQTTDSVGQTTTGTIVQTTETVQVTTDSTTPTTIDLTRQTTDTVEVTTDGPSKYSSLQTSTDAKTRTTRITSAQATESTVEQFTTDMTDTTKSDKESSATTISSVQTTADEAPSATTGMTPAMTTPSTVVESSTVMTDLTKSSETTSSTDQMSTATTSVVTETLPSTETSKVTDDSQPSSTSTATSTTEASTPSTGPTTTSTAEASTPSTGPTTTSTAEASTPSTGPTTTSTTEASTPSTGPTTTSTTEASTPSTGPLVTTESPFLNCSLPSDSGDFTQPDLDFSREQMRLWWKAEIDCPTTDDACVEAYESELKEILPERELVINQQETLKPDCFNKGIYLKLNFTLKGLPSKKIEFVSVVSLTTISGFTYSLSTMGGCASPLLTNKNLELATCLLYVTQIGVRNQHSLTHECQPFSLLGVQLKSFHMTIGCNEGWEKSADGSCKQISTTTTTSTTIKTSTDQTFTKQDTSAVSETTTTTMAVPTDPLQMLECYTCDGGSSNHDCNSTFESCLQDDAVCQTSVEYSAKSVTSISKTCETRSNCERRVQSGVCNTNSNNARCFYCCNQSRCNKDVELLDFGKGGKGRRKRSVVTEARNDALSPVRSKIEIADEDKENKELTRKKRSVVHQQSTGTWNRTVPKCIDTESPVFVGCPGEPLQVSGVLLPVPVTIDIPVAIDNSGIAPVVTTEPDISQPHLVYENSVITVTAVDSMKNSATCKIEIHITVDTKCPELYEPPHVNVQCKESDSSNKVCKTMCKDNSVFVQAPASLYDCSGDGVWRPSEFIPDCVPEDYSHCPIWHYSVSWEFNEALCIGIDCACDFIPAVVKALSGRLENSIDNVTAALSRSNGKVEVHAEFTMTGVRQSAQDACPALSDLSTIDDIHLVNACNKSASLTNPTLKNNTVNHHCEPGLVRSNDTKAADLCWPCPLGMEARNHVCLPCAVGSYRDNMLQTGCQSCPENTSTMHEFSRNQSDCKAVCEAGYFSPAGLVPCYSCARNTYQSGETPEACQHCPKDHCTTGTRTQSEDDCKESNCKRGACLSSPCQHSGICSEVLDAYTCDCTEGFTGEQCEIPYDLCAEQPCNYGNCVFNQEDRNFLCYCYPGFTGERCSENIDDCVENDCQNGGVCIDMIGSYVCDCTDTGYHGDHCEEKFSLCNHENCLNGGHCEELDSGFTCKCTEDFAGEFCEEKRSSCDNELCSYNGECVSSNETRTVCVCNANYTGEDCSLKLRCDDTLCGNHGYCFERSNGITCQCLPGFTGEMCEEKVVPHCYSNPCVHNNTLECVDKGIDFQCICHVGWQGQLCDEQIDLCQSEPCENGGNCSNHGDSYTCHCTPGFAWETCQKNLNECISSPCLNGGTCHDGINGFTCECLAGWSGDLCKVEEDACQSSPCVRGTCLDKMEGFVCLCESGWTGSKCNNRVDPCLSLPCQNQGICSVQNDVVACQCREGFTGGYCDIEVNPCESVPCLNGGTCIADDMTFTCDCSPGYHGDICDGSEALCNDSVCKNGGECVEMGLDVSCQCSPRFYGPRCLKEKSPNFDILFKKEQALSCSIGPVNEEIADFTFCTWIKITEGHGIVLQVVDARNQPVLTLQRDKLTISFPSQEDDDVDVSEVSLSITDQSWHQTCVTWSALANREWAVYLDAELIEKGKSYGRGITGFKNFTVNVDGTIEGAITGINIYSGIINNLDTSNCNSNHGNIVSWVEFESCAEDSDLDTMPSSCPKSSCSSSTFEDCSDDLDKAAPEIVFCPDDIVEVVFSDSLPIEISWSVPRFTDNTGVVDIKQTHQPGQIFTFGEYPVTYTAFDAHGNSASCTFRIYVTPQTCMEPAIPLHGNMSCDPIEDYGMDCTVWCTEGYMFAGEVAKVYTCRYGVWDPPRGKYFSLPACTKFANPLVEFDGLLTFLGPVCSESAKSDLIGLLSNQFLQTGLCSEPDCDTASMKVDCVLSGKMKRSLKTVQYNVTFTIKNNNVTAEDTAALTSQFENSLKSGIGEYKTLEVSMTTELKCALGQVLHLGRCVNCGLGYFHNTTAGLCDQCPLGEYNGREQQTTCRSCDKGQTTLMAGSISVKQCYYICEPGHYLLDNECEPCDIGFYQDQSGSTSCKPCPLGHNTVYTGATSLSDCNFMCNNYGMEMSVEGGCVPCPKGMYKADRSEVTCQPCPYGYTTLSTGAQTVEDCSLVKCGTGERRTSNNTCELCPLGTYQAKEDQDCCARCPFGQTTLQQGAALSTECVELAEDTDPCDLGLYKCEQLPGVCMDIDLSYRCQCCVGFTFQSGHCVDNCAGVCENGDCSKDTQGNPKCLCHDGYHGLRCEQKSEDRISTGVVAAICVSTMVVLLVIAVCVFICIRRYMQLSKNGDRYFPVHRSDLRSSFRAFALAMNPMMRFDGRTTRSASSGLESTRIPRPQWSEVEANSNSSGQTKDSYF